MAEPRRHTHEERNLLGHWQAKGVARTLRPLDSTTRRPVGLRLQLLERHILLLVPVARSVAETQVDGEHIREPGPQLVLGNDNSRKWIGK